MQAQQPYLKILKNCNDGNPKLKGATGWEFQRELLSQWEGVRVLKRTLALSGERWVLLGSSVGWGGSWKGPLPLHGWAQEGGWGGLRGGLREGGGEEEIWRGERDAKREDFFFFFSCARKENVCILGQVMRCLVYRLAQFRADLSKLRPEINKKTRRVVMRCGLLSLGQVCPTFRFTNLISKSWGQKFKKTRREVSCVQVCSV